MCTEEGIVYSWGEGQYGSLGLGSLVDQFKPKAVQMPNDAKIVELDCGI